MKLTKEIIRATVADLKQTKSQQEIEDYFKAALKIRTITLDNYCTAMEAIYN